MKWPEKRIIRGCEGRGDANSTYLVRYYLARWRDWALCLHLFHRSDADDLHDHPWDFWSLVLWGGYYEVTLPPGDYNATPRRTWRWPGSFARRLASHVHRVELFRRVDGTERRAATLVLMAPRTRHAWGFICRPYATGRRYWEHFAHYFQRNGC
jgi:hypothetical protein